MYARIIQKDTLNNIYKIEYDKSLDFSKLRFS